MRPLLNWLAARVAVRRNLTDAQRRELMKRIAADVRHAAMTLPPDEADTFLTELAKQVAFSRHDADNADEWF